MIFDVVSVKCAEKTKVILKSKNIEGFDFELVGFRPLSFCQPLNCVEIKLVNDFSKGVDA